MELNNPKAVCTRCRYEWRTKKPMPIRLKKNVKCPNCGASCESIKLKR